MTQGYESLSTETPIPARRGSGYRRAVKVYKLKFADDDFAGLEVRAKSVPLGTFLELTSYADMKSSSGFGPEELERVSRLFELFAGALLSWNLEDEDGTAVPATLDGLKSQEFDFVLHIVTAWLDAVAGVAAPLAPPSPNGATIPEASLPMVPLSPSPDSSAQPS